MSGYQLLTQEQREELDRLTEKQTHGELSGVEAIALCEYDVLCTRLVIEYNK